MRIEKTKPDIIGVTEVWQKDDIHVQGYQVAASKARPGEARGGGVILLVKEHLEVRECAELNNTMFNESAWCVVHLSVACKLLVGICYRPPNCSQENNQELLRLFEAIKKVHATDYLIMGDFNFREINWEDGSVTGPTDSDAALFYNKVQDCYLCQHVTFHTRYREGIPSSTLDLVFTDQENNVEEIECEMPLGKSDHCVITWEQRISCQQHGPHKESPPFNYRSGNYEAIKQELSDVNWDVMKDMGVEEAWIFFRDKLNNCRDKFVPRFKTRKKLKLSPPWWNKEIQTRLN